MIEFAIIALVGLCGLCRLRGSDRRLRMALRRLDFGHRRAGDARLPDRRHLSGAGVPRLRETIFPARLRLVGGVPGGDRCHLLRQDRRPIFAHLARHLLRRRPRRADRLSSRAVPDGAPLDPGRPARPPHHRGRRRRARRCADQVAGGATRQRRPRRRRVRRPRRRAGAGDHRRPPEARHGRRPGRVRAPHPHRSGDLLAADLGRRPHPADAQEAVGAAGRHPAVRRIPTSCASGRAPTRISATSRCSTSSTSRSPTGTW